MLERVIKSRMRPDEHGESTICNVYYDTPDYLLVRRSLDHPVYKEKIRMRSYGPAYEDDPVFLELKKKYKGVVYKRRISLPLSEAEAFMRREIPMPQNSQIGREIAGNMKNEVSLQRKKLRNGKRASFVQKLPVWI